VRFRRHGDAGLAGGALGISRGYSWARMDLNVAGLRFSMVAWTGLHAVPVAPVLWGPSPPSRSSMWTIMHHVPCSAARSHVITDHGHNQFTVMGLGTHACKQTRRVTHYRGGIEM
jgi:hypothetical protein